MAHGRPEAMGTYEHRASGGKQGDGGARQSKDGAQARVGKSRKWLSRKTWLLEPESGV